jgi:YegS/Rv2252/BmrU family lipid kinase
MPQHKTKLIVNPNADMGRAWLAAADLRPVVEEFGGADWTGTVYPTHATELAVQAADEGYEMVIAAGGDGTVHEIINGLMRIPFERRPRLGVIPLGTGNDFSSAVGLNHNPNLAARQLFTGKPRRVDIGVLRDGRGREEYWDNTVGLGFDTTVTIRSRKIPLLHGFMLYLAAVLQTIILNHDPLRLEVKTDEGGWIDEMLLLVLCNGGREGGGFFVSPEARPDDGVFHYTAIQRVSRPMMLRILPEVLKGTHGRLKQVKMGQFHKMDIQSNKSLYIHTDGEIFAGFGVDVRLLSVEIIPGAIEVVV